MSEKSPKAFSVIYMPKDSWQGELQVIFGGGGDKVGGNIFVNEPGDVREISKGIFCNMLATQTIALLTCSGTIQNVILT